MKRYVDLPKNPYGLLFDGQWHAASVAVPVIYQGRFVRYYLMFFDKDISAIEFKDIYFS